MPDKNFSELNTLQIIEENQRKSARDHVKSYGETVRLSISLEDYTSTDCLATRHMLISHKNWLRDQIASELIRAERTHAKIQENIFETEKER